MCKITKQNYFNYIFEVIKKYKVEYKKIQSYLEQTKVGLNRLEELEAHKRAEEDRIKTKS